MKPPPFAYRDPQSVREALEILTQSGDDGKILAGGQSLVPLLNMRLAQPSVLIDLNRVDALRYIRPESRSDRHGFAIGAMTRHQSIERSEEIRDRIPALHEGMGFVGHPQIRTRGTIGGSIAHADPAAELPLLFRALDGEATVLSASGEKTVPASEFFLYTFTTAMESTDMLAEVWFPALSPRAGQAFVEVARRHGDFALVAVAATVSLDRNGHIAHAAIAIGGAAPVPMRATTAEQMLIGQRPGLPLFREAGQAAADETDPTGDVHADTAYRRDVAGSLTARALTRAWERVPREDA